MKRILPLILVAGALLVAATVALAGGGPSRGQNDRPNRGPKGKVIHVIEHATTDAVTNHANGDADSVGDVLTFANELFDSTNSRHAGTDQGFCIRMIVGQSWECAWTNFLAGGQITVEGPFYDTKDSRLAVTGGTGRYSHARGWMELKSRAGGTEFDFIFHLIG